MAQTQTVGRGIRPYWALITGDVVAIIVFAAIGRGSHGEATGLMAPVETLGTAAPFIAGWLIAAPLAGAYGPQTQTLRGMATRTVLAWLIAMPLGLGLRALLLQRGIPVSFAIVASISNLVLLLGWRSLFALLKRRGS